MLTITSAVSEFSMPRLIRKPTPARETIISAATTHIHAMLIAVFSPAMMEGMQSGRATWNRSWRSFAPRTMPAFRTSGSTMSTAE